MDVYILDDDPAIRRLITRLIQGTGHVAHEFQSAVEFRRVVAESTYGCIMLDIAMPGPSGLDLLEDLVHTTPAWPVIMISGTTDVTDAITAFQRGATHFLRKPFRRKEFLAALAAAAALVEQRLAALDRQRRACAVALTRREREVLDAMDHGEQSKTIAWKLGLSQRTIDMHRTNILKKLSARNATHAVATARDLGLLAS